MAKVKSLEFQSKCLLRVTHWFSKNNPVLEKEPCKLYKHTQLPRDMVATLVPDDSKLQSSDQAKFSTNNQLAFHPSFGLPSSTDGFLQTPLIP